MTAKDFDEWIAKLVEYAMTDVEVDATTDARLRRQIDIMLRQAERETRHLAYARIQECANTVNDQRPLYL